MKKILTGAFAIFTLSVSAQALTATSDTSSLTRGWIKVFSDGHMGYLDDEGQEVIPPIYDEIGRFGDYCNEGALVRQGNLYGLVDIYGNIIAEVQYEEIGRANEYKPGWVLIKKEGLYGFIDCSGEEVVEPIYTEIVTKPENLNRMFN